ncbi:MAG: ATP-binding protein, partial [Phycisphaerae bacterium]
MALADFIAENTEPILEAWEAFARSLLPGKAMTKLALRNDAGSILSATVRDMRAAQTVAEQVNKSMGLGGAGGEESDRLDHASVMHGVGRVGSGFDIMEVVAEYRALRATVLRLWRQSCPEPEATDLDDVTRFNEAMDQSMAQAVRSYTKRVDQSRHMFLAILSHDLRNPLNGIRMAAQFVSGTVSEDPDSAEALSIIEANVDAVTRLIGDLTDFASTGLGGGMPLTRGPVDLERICRETVRSFGLAHPRRTFRFDAAGDLAGDWDAARLRQVVSNLMGNAIQHGAIDGPVEVTAACEGPNVLLRVRNEGRPIPEELLTTIFDPLRRFATTDAAARQAGSIGLGLYIVREIA